MHTSMNSPVFRAARRNARFSSTVQKFCKPTHLPPTADRKAPRSTSSMGNSAKTATPSKFGSRNAHAAYLFRPFTAFLLSGTQFEHQYSCPISKRPLKRKSALPQKLLRGKALFKDMERICQGHSCANSVQPEFGNSPPDCFIQWVRIGNLFYKTRKRRSY